MNSPGRPSGQPAPLADGAESCWRPKASLTRPLGCSSIGSQTFWPDVRVIDAGRARFVPTGLGGGRPVWAHIVWPAGWRPAARGRNSSVSSPSGWAIQTSELSGKQEEHERSTELLQFWAALNSDKLAPLGLRSVPRGSQVNRLPTRAPPCSQHFASIRQLAAIRARAGTISGAFGWRRQRKWALVPANLGPLNVSKTGGLSGKIGPGFGQTEKWGRVNGSARLG